MSRMANCGRVRGWMADAASGSLSGARRGEFVKHVGGCAACRAEFQRVESLLGKIDQNLRAAFAVEPSPQLLANVRQSIAAEPQRSTSWIGSNRRFAAAVACAAFAVVLFVVIVLHRANEPSRHYVSGVPVANSAPTRLSAAIGRSASAENVPPVIARAHSSKPRLAVAHQQLPRNPHPRSSEPEVIVQPGQMLAILQFVAEMQNGKINGAAIEKGIQEAQKPLEIKPLEITPLDASAGESSDPRATSSHESGSSNGRLE